MIFLPDCPEQNQSIHSFGAKCGIQALELEYFVGTNPDSLCFCQGVGYSLATHSSYMYNYVYFLKYGTLKSHPLVWGWFTVLSFRPEWVIVMATVQTRHCLLLYRHLIQLKSGTDLEYKTFKQYKRLLSQNPADISFPAKLDYSRSHQLKIELFASS